MYIIVRLPVHKRCAVAHDDAASDDIRHSGTSVAAVAFYGVYNSIHGIFYNTYMVGYTVSVPVKENNVAGDRLIPAILPQVLFFKPGNTAVTIGKTWVLRRL